MPKGIKGFQKGCHHKSEFKKGNIPWIKGKHRSKETKLKISIGNKGKKHSQETRKKLSTIFKKRKYPNRKSAIFTEEHRKNMSKALKGRKVLNYATKGQRCHLWKGGISKDKKWVNKRNKIWRHKKGISKKYQSELGISYTKEYKKYMRCLRRSRFRNAGKLTTKTIQLVYEDNIKQYGTLTCYLCLKPIPFGKDHLEHKTPLSRSGTNEYNNLGIACQRCNNRKFTKTEQEFRKEILSL